MSIRSLIAEFHEDFPNRLGVNIISPSDDRLPRKRQRMVREAPKLSGTAQERFVKSRGGSPSSRSAKYYAQKRRDAK